MNVFEESLFYLVLLINLVSALHRGILQQPLDSSLPSPSSLLRHDSTLEHPSVTIDPFVDALRPDRRDTRALQ